MGSSYLRTAMKMRYISLFCFVLFSELHEIMGHGAMYYPMPWHATSDCTPGAAVTFGNGCGVNGGNPDGCDGEDLTFGRCCGGGGKSALEHYHEGFFGSPNVTKWRRGEPAEVYWN